jgi:hypothetical protein
MGNECVQFGTVVVGVGAERGEMREGGQGGRTLHSAVGALGGPPGELAEEVGFAGGGKEVGAQCITLNLLQPFSSPIPSSLNSLPCPPRPRPPPLPPFHSHEPRPLLLIQRGAMPRAGEQVIPVAHMGGQQQGTWQVEGGGAGRHTAPQGSTCVRVATTQLVGWWEAGKEGREGMKIPSIVQNTYSFRYKGRGAGEPEAVGKQVNRVVVVMDLRTSPCPTDSTCAHPTVLGYCWYCWPPPVHCLPSPSSAFCCCCCCCCFPCPPPPPPPPPAAAAACLLT